MASNSLFRDDGDEDDGSLFSESAPRKQPATLASAPAPVAAPAPAPAPSSSLGGGAATATSDDPAIAYRTESLFVGSVELSAAQELVEFKKAAALAKAREVCDGDIVRYSALYQDCIASDLDALQRGLPSDLDALQRVVEGLPVDGREPMQPQLLEGVDPQDLNADYLFKLNLAFRAVDATIFAEAEAVAKYFGLVLKKGKVKTKERCNEKAILAYGGDLSRLKDLRRASILCPKIASITEVLSLLSNTEGFDILRVKNRFSRKYDGTESAGYRDVQLNVRAKGTALVWELQLHLEAIEKLKSSLDENGGKGHENYKLYRMQMERIKKGIF